MVLFQQHIELTKIANLLLSLGGIAGGTGLTIIRTLHPYENGILFLLGVVSYLFAIYASIVHIKQIRNNKKK